MSVFSETFKKKELDFQDLHNFCSTVLITFNIKCLFLSEFLFDSSGSFI